MTLLRLEDAETISAREPRRILLLVETPAVTITWSRFGPGEHGPRPHVHREHVDAFYVLEGEVTFTIGPDAHRVTLGPGGAVAVPPNLAHTYANASGADASWLNMHAPDTGFAAYLRDLRDGRPTNFDQFDPPPDGGRPAGDVVVAQGHPLVLPQLLVAELNAHGGHGYAFAVDGGFVEIQAPSRS